MATVPAGTATGSLLVLGLSRIDLSETAASKTWLPGTISRGPWLTSVSTSEICSEAVSDEQETTAGATSRWNCCASAPGDVTMKPLSSSGSCVEPSATARKGCSLRATAVSASWLPASTGNALWTRLLLSRVTVV